ncbi:hypothetical protein [Nocardioides sp.]|uniref:hypothetical protein n=1 Tax=Nocardioides sp. TaxID=35761 RepID=UPI002BA179F5|nr:hypothetical protein [Nocardioides sp.]HXH77322.1 hypothetical protein [Nocardioides sp.]
MDLSALARAAKSEPADPDTFTALVVRADESGLWVAPLGDDTQIPFGPCRGGYTAQGTLTPVGSLVVLILTPDGPWAVGLDNPALAIADGTLAPFDNPSFEVATADGYAVGWSDFWSESRRIPNPTTVPVPVGKYRFLVEDGNAAHGARSHRTDANQTTGVLESNEWSVPPGSSIEVSIYARAVGNTPKCSVAAWTNVAGQYAGPFGSGAGLFYPIDITPGPDWLRYRGVVTLPPTHSRVNLLINTGDEVGISTVWIDNVDADLVELDPAAAHQEFMRRAALTLTGGGIRTVTAGGNVSWSQVLTIAALGYETTEANAGRFDIAQPPNGTVIPVHSSAARTSHTVAGGVIALNPDDALWYELPLGSVAASQPGRFHIIGSTSDDGYVVPPHWVLIVRRIAWSPTSYALEYLWGDGRGQDPWRTPPLNAGWVEGTVVPRFTKSDTGDVRMKGRVRSGTGSAFTLIEGYRPGVGGHRAIVPDGVGAAALLTVTAAGVVTTAGNNTDHSIETAFAAEQ